MVCAELVQIDGQQLLAVVSNAPCTATQLVLLTPGELDSLTASPFRLSLAEGGAVATAILAVWALAFAFKAFAQTLSSGDPERN